VFEFVVFHFLYSYPKTQRESCVVFKDWTVQLFLFFFKFFKALWRLRPSITSMLFSDE
jgi:hypothetical protein